MNKKKFDKYKLAFRYFELTEIISANAHIIQKTKDESKRIKAREENLSLLAKVLLIKNLLHKRS